MKYPTTEEKLRQLEIFASDLVEELYQWSFVAQIGRCEDKYTGETALGALRAYLRLLDRFEKRGK